LQSFQIKQALFEGIKMDAEQYKIQQFGVTKKNEILSYHLSEHSNLYASQLFYMSTDIKQLSDYDLVQSNLKL